LTNEEVCDFEVELSSGKSRFTSAERSCSCFRCHGPRARICTMRATFSSLVLLAAALCAHAQYPNSPPPLVIRPPQLPGAVVDADSEYPISLGSSVYLLPRPSTGTVTMAYLMGSPRLAFNTITHWLRLDRLDYGEGQFHMQRARYSEDNAWSVESLLGTGKSRKTLVLAFDGEQDDGMIQGMCLCWLPPRFPVVWLVHAPRSPYCLRLWQSYTRFRMHNICAGCQIQI